MSKSKFTIVNVIMAAFNLGDAGKLDSFFTKQTKVISRKIETLKRNLENTRFKNEQEIDALQEELDDAKAALDAAFANVPVDKITTNAEQDAYGEIYWANIERAQENVLNIQSRIESTNKLLGDTVETIEAQMAELEARLNRIS